MMSARRPWLASFLFAFFSFVLVGSAQAAPQFNVTTAGADIVIYTINEPKVQQRTADYPQATFQVGDLITVSASSCCCQTGGIGRTWKRYVDPSGKDSDRLYHGLIQLPGRPMTRIQNLMGKLWTFLRAPRLRFH